MTPSPDNDLDRFACSYAGDTGTLAALRAEVASFLRGHDVGVELVDRVILALTELATNAIEAAPRHAYTVAVELGTEAIWAEVSNVRPLVGRPTPSPKRRQTQGAPGRAQGIPPRTEWGPEDTLTPRGRGLLLVEALTDSLDISNDESTSTASITLAR
jgi:anti-sigma regulatory factor (Ser/Thr protein kinase)